MTRQKLSQRPRHVSPTLPRSRTRCSTPACVSSWLSESPAWPAPITATSTGSGTNAHVRRLPERRWLALGRLMKPRTGKTEHVDVDGLHIAHRRAGTGPPLLLLHGAPGDSRLWRTQLEELSDDFTPGFGESADPPESLRMREFGACLAGFVNALGLWRPHVLGHSWGSALALELYRQLPSVPRRCCSSAPTRVGAARCHPTRSPSGSSSRSTPADRRRRRTLTAVDRPRAP